MALIRLDHVPESIRVNLPLYLIIPDPKKVKEMPIRDRKVLYLLHGLSDDGSAWQRFSSIETFAYAQGLVVVMPSFGRSFYVDQPNGQKYFSYLVDELPQYLSDVFNITPNRENTFIAGNSMGGYGTFKAAFLHPEKYRAAFSLSGVLSLAILDNHSDKRQPEFEHLFGDLSKLPGSQHDPAVWIKQAIEKKMDLPKLFIACGKQDDLYPLSVMFHSACQAAGFDVQYQEEDAQHDWIYWDKMIKWFIEEIIYSETTRVSD
jgi:S-formylglutathione hydrolase FrmB